MNAIELQSVVWSALEGVARKETRRDALPGGAEYDVILRVSGEVKTKAFACEVEAHLIVNEDTTRLKSEAAPIPHVLACILAMVPKTKRETLLRDLPETFADNDNLLPEVDAELVDAATKLLERLRAKVQQKVRGALSTSYRIHSLAPNP